ncbi:PAAR domain-containing protein [Rhizobium halophytocola]|uniref:PaaR repeat-containing protein n=1 Tax=Rhizobium halophytocola TaxID=735519 RepID=A0ABS4E3J7_9HYPH|nr:PAAR domain-containing protein [Rhizobium halophytocola]MBP1852522.1 hypothetical protein [Rhizobium halophytocola]
MAGHAGPHPRALAAGSATVFINGKAAGRIGDAVDCGGSAETGSSNVYIGDDGGGAGGAGASTSGTPCQKSMAASSTPGVRG